MASAVSAFQGIPALIDAAVQKALAAGATAGELQAVTELSSTVRGNATALAAAVAAATPAAAATPPEATAAFKKLVK